MAFVGNKMEMFQPVLKMQQMSLLPKYMMKFQKFPNFQLLDLTFWFEA
jgi:hypothetical protein